MSRTKLPEIGQRMYAVHKSSVKDKHNGTRLMICRVKTYENVDGKVRPVLQVVGTKQEVNQSTYNTYLNLEQAIKAITFK